MSSRTQGKDRARARAAEMRAAQVRAERRRRVALATGAIGLVLVRLTKDDSGKTAAAPAASALPASVLRDVTKVPSATFDTVGTTGVAVLPSSIDAPALTAGGKPKMLYVGAEYCPFCAAQRWPVTVALSRFGTWSGLGATESSAQDVYPSTPTLSFHGARFTSDVLTFAGYETQSNKIVSGQYAPLDTVPAADKKVFDTYNKPPFIANSSGGIPFIDIGGKYVASGATFNPDLLKGKTRAQIAAAIADPSSEIGKAVVGNANVLSAAICKVTNGQPADVCTSAGVKAGAAALSKGQQK
jgi:Domain of unknown function (DUF929)